MTDRTTTRQATDQSEDGGIAPRCRRLLSIEQAADTGDVSMQEIRRCIQSGKLPAYRVAGGLRIDEVELAVCLSFLESEQP